ncbi:MAG TPA: hypothetical protein DHU63_01980 [Candidatus Marinimicrobia bacterium]|nr:hypothetical protein [Candidatus Neomarinimicrobiota bacterium]
MANLAIAGRPNLFRMNGFGRLIVLGRMAIGIEAVMGNSRPLIVKVTQGAIRKCVVEMLANQGKTGQGFRMCEMGWIPGCGAMTNIACYREIGMVRCRRNLVRVTRVAGDGKPVVTKQTGRPGYG